MSWIVKAVNSFTINHDEEGLIESKILQARIYRCRGNYQGNLDLLDEVERLISPEKLGNRFDLPLEKSLSLNMNARFKESEEVLVKALALAEQNDDKYIIAHLLEGLGNVNYFLGNYPRALQLYKRGAETSPEQILPSYYTQDSISTIYQDWGEFDQAFEYAKRSVAIKENLGMNEALPSAYIQLASIFEDLSEPDIAENYYRKAINLIRENNGERFYLVLNLAFLARCLGLQDRWVEARITVEEALIEAKAQSGNLALGVCQMVVAPVYIQTGNIDEGVEMLHQAITTFENTGFKKALSYGYTNLAWAYLIENQREKACQYAEEGLKIASRINFRQYYLTFWKLLHPVLQLAMEYGIEVAFVQRILIQVGERSLVILKKLANHPVPVVRSRVNATLNEILKNLPKDRINPVLAELNSGITQLGDCANFTRHFLSSSKKIDEHYAPLQISCLGPILVYINGDNVGPQKWRTLKTRDLLLYLAHQAGPIAKERILEDLWPHLDPKRANDLLHTTLYYLRRILNPKDGVEFIIYGGKTYQLAPDIFSNDRRQFEHLLTFGAANKTHPETAISYFEEAITLYRGEYLEELDYPWLIPEREHLKRQYIETRFTLSRYYLGHKEFTKAIAHLNILKEITPLTEEVYCLLMSIYAEIGNFSAAREEYQMMVKILKDELDLPPSIESIDLYHRIFK
ncbi:MAG: BTAD domain-containing putative transcriptional regulator [Bacteroidota bacterium]